MADPISLENIGGKMLDAAAATFGARSAAVKSYLKDEAEKSAITLRKILSASAKGEISSDEASILLNAHRDAWAAVLNAAGGMTEAAVQAAITAGFGAVRDFVNGKLGFSLI